jgi:hypothetical protein
VTLREEINRSINMGAAERESMIRIDIVAILLGYGYETHSARHLAVRMLDALRDEEDK